MDSFENMIGISGTLALFIVLLIFVIILLFRGIKVVILDEADNLSIVTVWSPFFPLLPLTVDVGATKSFTEEDVKLTSRDVWKQKDVQDVFSPDVTEEEAIQALKKCRNNTAKLTATKTINGKELKKEYNITLATAMWDTKPIKLEEDQE